MAQRAPKVVLARLEEALKANTMVRAAFVPPDDATDLTYTDEIREATRLYRETWIEYPLKQVLAYLKGEITADQIDEY